jgi:hypothetical protein
MTRTQLFLLAGMALVLLLNFIRRLRLRRVEGDALPRPASDVSETPRPDYRPFPIMTPRRPPVTPDTIPLPRAVPRMLPRRRTALGDLQAVRRGIMLITILGPCRALEPPDPQA